MVNKKKKKREKRQNRGGKRVKREKQKKGTKEEKKRKIKTKRGGKKGINQKKAWVGGAAHLLAPSCSSMGWQRGSALLGGLWGSGTPNVGLFAELQHQPGGDGEN